VTELSSPVEERDKSLQSERRRQIRGSLWLAGAALLFAILRAGVHRVFGPGWWRLW
jgi:hypothetical protein